MASHLLAPYILWVNGPEAEKEVGGKREREAGRWTLLDLYTHPEGAAAGRQGQQWLLM